MKAVTFGEFYDACKDSLTDCQLRDLDGGAEYFQLRQGGYCGLVFSSDGEKDSVWVSIFVGEMRDLWNFRAMMQEAGVYRVGFACRPGSVTHKLATYYDAKWKLVEETYADGGVKLECVVYLKQTKRLTNVSAEMALAS